LVVIYTKQIATQSGLQLPSFIFLCRNVPQSLNSNTTSSRFQHVGQEDRIPILVTN